MSCIDNLSTERATNGAMRGRSFFAAVKRVYSLLHVAIDTAQYNDLMVFYAANKALPVSFTWPHDGTVVTAIFTAPPTQKAVRPGSCVDVSVQLAEV